MPTDAASALFLGVIGHFVDTGILEWEDITLPGSEKRIMYSKVTASLWTFKNRGSQKGHGEAPGNHGKINIGLN